MNVHGRGFAAKVSSNLFKFRVSRWKVRNNTHHAHIYSCPACRSKCFKYLACLNEHFDHCLSIHGEKKPKVKVKQDTKISKYFKTIKSEGGKKRRLVLKDENVHADAKRKKSNNADGRIACPICQKQRFARYSAPNKHIDECLKTNSQSTKTETIAP